MTLSADKAGRKKNLKEFFNLLMIPLVLAMVNSIFFKMAMVSFTGGPGTRKSLVRINSAGLIGTDFGFSFALMAVLVYFWVRPAYLYVKEPSEKLKVILRLRIGNIYRDAFLMLVIVQAAALGIFSFGTGLPAKAELVAAAVSFLAQAALLIVYIDGQLSKQKNLMDGLYSPEELSSSRSGFSIPVYIKFSMMIAGFAIVPFLLVYFAALRQVPWEKLTEPLVVMLFTSAILLLHGLNNVYLGIQKPLDGLICKMKRVASGDYAKTRIYFTDEVASLKAGFNDMVDGLKEREELQDTFGKYLSIEIARELIKNKKVNLGGEDMEAAVMFCDIRNFTTLSEKLAASDLVDFLNGYFQYITPPIIGNKGVINKFMGDAVMAIYTPLLGSTDYAADAVRAAVGMRTALAQFNASGKAPGIVEFGIGIHSGRLVGGNIGTAFRMEYTFIGDTVNIAARLEAKTRDFNTDILVSGSAVQKAAGGLGGAMAFESLGKAALKGKSEMVEIFKVL